MPGKSNEGFTKAANKMKFVRNRDIKMKNVEIKREANIQKLMCEGVCAHCRDKVQWKFKYNKYKPLTKPASCGNCKNKTVTKAYRTFCDACANKKKVCAACCKDMILANAEYYENHPAAKTEGEDNNKVDGDNNDQKATMDTAEHEQEMAVCGGAGENMESDDNDDMEDDDEDDASDNIQLAVKESNARSEGTGMSARPPHPIADTWDERAFTHVISSKYNKSRVVGSTEDAAVP